MVANEIQSQKSRSCTIINGKQKEVRFKISRSNIPKVKEEPVKSLGRWYKNGLNGRYKGVEVYQQAQEGLKAIDKVRLTGKFKVWCLQYVLRPSLIWPLTMYEVAATRV